MCHQIDSKVDKESHSTSELSAKWQLFDSQYHSLYFFCNWQISLKIIYVIAFEILGKDPESPSHGNRRLRHKVACNMQTFFLWGVFTASDGFPWLVFLDYFREEKISFVPFLSGYVTQELLVSNWGASLSQTLGSQTVTGQN